MAYADDDQIEQLRRLWERFGVPAVLVLALGIAAVLGWQWYAAHQRTQAQRASAAYEAVLGAADLAQARSRVEALRAAHGDSPYVLLADLHLAARALEAEDLASAEAALRDALAHAQREFDRDLVRVRLGRVLLDLGRLEEAATLAGEVQHPALAVKAAELRGDVARAQGRTEDARAAYQAALAAAGDSAQANLIRLKLDDLGS